jgi:hypothetical protein
MASKRKSFRKKSKLSKYNKNKKTLKKFVTFARSKKNIKKHKKRTKKYFKGGVGDDDENCGICLKNFEKDNNNQIIDDIISLNCGHKFHKDELIEWYKRKKNNSTCPTCRAPIADEMQQFVPPNSEDSEDSGESSDSSMEDYDNSNYISDDENSEDERNRVLLSQMTEAERAEWLNSRFQGYMNESNNNP